MENQVQAGGMCGLAYRRLLDSVGRHAMMGDGINSLDDAKKIERRPRSIGHELGYEGTVSSLCFRSRVIPGMAPDLWWEIVD